MMALSMAIQYLDKQALPAASILGLIKDLVCSFFHLPNLLRLTDIPESRRLPVLLGELSLLLPLPDLCGVHGVAHGAATVGKTACCYVVSSCSFPIRKSTDLTCSCSFGWAVIIGCHAAVRNFAGLMTVRFMLGAVEAAAIPCFSMMTGMWFRKEEHPLRHGFWFLGTSTGSWS